MRKKILLTAFLLLIVTGFINGQRKELVKIKVEAGKSIRQISQQYLGDPNLWEDILASNGIKSVNDVKAGMELLIPVKAIKEARSEVEAALKAISEATDAGARVFAEKTINLAIDLHKQAVRKREKGDFDQCIKLASQAVKEAEKARREAGEKRNVSAEATLTSKKGTVENKPPAQSYWNSIELNSKLKEGEKVRTKSDSGAEITFQDGNRIRLNENAQALIQTMRIDLLNKKRQSNVSLEQGDAFAYLKGSRTKKNFNVDIKGLNTNVKSNNFWVKKDKNSTKIANYDGEIEVSAKGKTVVIKKNQGLKVDKGRELKEPKALLAEAELTGPENRKLFFNEDVILSWNPVNDASSYWVEISREESFEDLFIFHKGVTKTTFNFGNKGNGIYYWRIAAVDKEGLPGPKGNYRSFRVQPDKLGPYLVIFEPEEDSYTTAGEITLKGKTETESVLSINDKNVKVEPDGSFSAAVTLEEGANTIRIIAVDKAGNKSEIERKVIRDSSNRIDINFDDSINRNEAGDFLIKSNVVNLRGTTKANSKLEFTSIGQGTRYGGYSKKDGSFYIKLRTSGSEEKFILRIIAESGVVSEDTLTFRKPAGKPVIKPGALPASVNDAEININGTVENCSKLSLNGSPLKIAGNRFSGNIALNEGENILSFTGSDDFGNNVTIERRVIRDSQPPELITFNSSKGKDSEYYTFSVTAKDNSGLKKLCVASVEDENGTHSVNLLLDASGLIYTGKIVKKLSGKVEYLSITLEDYLGNKKTYSIEKNRIVN